jgi:hypothetical protein
MGSLGHCGHGTELDHSNGDDFINLWNLPSNLWIFAWVLFNFMLHISLEQPMWNRVTLTWWSEHLHRNRFRCVILPDFSVFNVCRETDCLTVQVIWRWLLTTNPWVESQVVALYERDKDFTLLINILPLLHTHLSLLLKVCDGPD